MPDLLDRLITAADAGLRTLSGAVAPRRAAPRPSQTASLDEPDRRCFVLDVGAIQYFASAALGKLVGLNRKARQADARLVLCAVTPTVARVLEISRLSDVLIRYDDEDGAVRALSEPA